MYTTLTYLKRLTIYPSLTYNLISIYSLLANVTEVYLPLLWFEELASLPEDLAKEMNTLLFIMNTPTITIIFSVMVGLGVIGFIFGLVMHYKRKRDAA